MDLGLVVSNLSIGSASHAHRVNWTGPLAVDCFHLSTQYSLHPSPNVSRIMCKVARHSIPHLQHALPTIMIRFYKIDVLCELAQVLVFMKFIMHTTMQQAAAAAMQTFLELTDPRLVWFNYFLSSAICDMTSWPA
jgi:hypothetical protein